MSADKISSLKQMCAETSLSSELPMDGLPKDVIEFCEETDYAERMRLINQVRPADFEANDINDCDFGEGTCGDNCVIETGSCFQNTVIEPVRQNTISNFEFSACGWVTDFRLVEVDENNNTTKFVKTWEAGIKRLELEIGGSKVNIIPGELLQVMATEFGLSPEQLPLLIPGGSDRNMMIPETYYHCRKVRIQFECRNNIKLLVTHSYHYNYKFDEQPFGVPQEIALLFGMAPNSVMIPFQVDVISLGDRGSTTGVQKLVIPNARFPQDRTFYVKDFNMYGKPFHFQVPSTKIRKYENFTIVDVRDLTFDILLEGIWYISRNSYRFLGGMGGSKYCVYMSSIENDNRHREIGHLQ